MTALDDGPPECGTVIHGYCQEKKPKIDVKCHNVKKQAGDMILFEINDQTCYCICSCLGKGALVTVDDAGRTVKVEDMVEKTTKVLAAGRGLQFKQQTVQVVSHSAIGRIDHAIYLKYRAGGKDYESCVTMSHPYMLKDGTLVGAEALSLNSELIDRNGDVVEIQQLSWGVYEGQFWEFSVTDEIPDNNLTNHLVLTNGVVTGDFAVEQWVHYRRKEPGVAAAVMPAIVGSKAWIAATGHRMLSKEDEPVRRVGNGYFIPAAHTRVVIPPHASSFLPGNEAAWLEEIERIHRPYNDPLAHELGVYLLDRLFRPAFKDIEFHFDWFSYTVNSHSWVDDDHKKNVLLSGGLLRLKGFDLQGVALALAHEVGHLEGKPDIGRSGVTCEGEADWWAGYAVLPQLWFAQDYFENMKKAIAQVETIYGYLDDPSTAQAAAFDRTAPIDDRGRRYPDHACRLDTFETAMHSVDQPECSKCSVP
jgi:hypothetical protein